MTDMNDRNHGGGYGNWPQQPQQPYPPQQHTPQHPYGYPVDDEAATTLLPPVPAFDDAAATTLLPPVPAFDDAAATTLLPPVPPLDDAAATTLLPPVRVSGAMPVAPPQHLGQQPVQQPVAAGGIVAVRDAHPRAAELRSEQVDGQRAGIAVGVDDRIAVFPNQAREEPDVANRPAQAARRDEQLPARRLDGVADAIVGHEARGEIAPHARHPSGQPKRREGQAVPAHRRGDDLQYANLPHRPRLPHFLIMYRPLHYIL